MTTQHAPRTPMWRQVLSLPQTRLGWWAIGLVGIYWALAATVNFTDRLSVLGTVVASGGSVVYLLVFIPTQLAGVVGTVVALIALLRSHERSALVWLAMVAGLPALLPLVWIFLVLGDGLGGIPTLWVMIALAGLIGVLIAWLQRHKSGEPR